MKTKLPLAFIATAIAIAITTSMDITGFAMYSALPLVLITAIFWIIDKQSLQSIGLRIGKIKYYGTALVYPILVNGLCILSAMIFGDINFNEFEQKDLKNILLASSTGIIGTLITEEGFFRGWLWGSLKKRSWSNLNVLWFSSIIFMVWHISVIIFYADYGLPLFQVPIYLINATLLGLIWGAMRMISGSVIVPALCHSVWNALAYTLFAFGENIGALGVKNGIFFGPEVGLAGIIFNGLFFIWIFNRLKKKEII